MKHLQKLGYVAIGSMLTVAIMGTALAASGAMTITVDPINIQVNGATFAPKDAQGNSVPVFSYNGTTYAPLRALAEAYGLNVGYDSKNNMATVGAAGDSQTGGQSGAQETPAPTTTPTDPNRVPDITVDELKALFEFDQVYESHRIDGSKRDDCYFQYHGEDAIDDDFLKWWSALNEEDVKAALTILAEDFYVNGYSGKNDIVLFLDGKSGGTTLCFAWIEYSQTGEVKDFRFNQWVR